MNILYINYILNYILNLFKKNLLEIIVNSKIFDNIYHFT